MATRKKPPSPAQLRARKKFVIMVRRRAREAKAAKRATGIHRPATKRATIKRRNATPRKRAIGWLKSGLGLSGRKAKARYKGIRKVRVAAEKKRRNFETASAAHPISVRHYYRSGGPGYMSAWKRAESKGQQRLFKMNPGESVKVRRNGVTKKLYGAAALAVLKSRARRNGSVKSPTSTRTATRTATDAKTWGNVTVTGGAGRGATTRVTIQAPGKKRGAVKRGRNGIFRTAVRTAITRRLHAPIGRRRRNTGAPAGIESMHEKFLGRPSGHEFEIVAPSGTPKDVAVLGELTKLKTEDEEFVFDKGEAYMGADAKGNLYVLGDVQVESNTSFGEIDQICYLARKDHLEANPFGFRRRKAKRNAGTLTEYFHDFAEDGGKAPKLKSDADGMLHIQGGTFTVEAEGITG